MKEEESRPDANKYKIVAFARAIRAIEGLDYPLASLKSTDARRTAEKAKIVRGIGHGIAHRIAVYLHEGDEHAASSSKEGLSSVQREPVPELDIETRKKAIASLQLVPGIGKKLATDLVNEGCLSLQHLRDPHFKDLLSPPIQVGVEFIDHILQEVTREQTESSIALIRDALEPTFEIHAVGPFRRGLPSSPSLSLLLLHPSYNPPLPTPAYPPDEPGKGKKRGRNPHAFRPAYSAGSQSTLMARRVLKRLTEEGVIAGVLSSSTELSVAVVRMPRAGESREERLRAVERREGVFRKAEFHLAPFKSKAAALLALTGDAEFLRDAQTRALEQRMHLSEYGLWQWVSLDSPRYEDEGKWERMEVASEQELFEKLGMAWVEPEKRNFGFVVGRAASGRGRGRPRKVV